MLRQHLLMTLSQGQEEYTSYGIWCNQTSVCEFEHTTDLVEQKAAAEHRYLTGMYESAVLDFKWVVLPVRSASKEELRMAALNHARYEVAKCGMELQVANDALSSLLALPHNEPLPVDTGWDDDLAF